MKILILAPHPDDDLLGCGGSIIKHLHAGNQIHVAYLTSGDAVASGTKKGDFPREIEARNALKLIGVPKLNLHFLRQPDGRLAGNLSNVAKIVRLIRNIQPHILYLPHRTDDHPDHTETYHIGMKAILQAGIRNQKGSKELSWKVGAVLAYEVWTPLQRPNYLEDITDVMELKVKALLQHRSQLSLIAYDDLARSLNLYRGILLGKSHYAEAFSILQFPCSTMTSLIF